MPYNIAVNPERIIREAQRLLNKLAVDGDEALADRLDNSLVELEALAMSLDRAGIRWIKPDGTHNGEKK